MLPPASNTPTTRHRCEPHLTSRPRSTLPNCANAPRPTMTSSLPGSNMRPATILKPVRTSVARLVTPRNGTFAAVPVLRIGRSTIV